MIDPMDQVEMRNAITNAAQMTRAFYLECVAEGFSKREALTLSGNFLAALATAPSTKENDDS